MGRYPESLYRDSIVTDEMVRHHGGITVETITNTLRNEWGKPDSVCRHPAPRVGGTLSATVATIVMNTTLKKMWITPSPYKNQQTTEYGFD